MIKVTTKANDIFYFTDMIYPMPCNDGEYGIYCFNYNNKHNTCFLLEDIKSIGKQVSDLTTNELCVLKIRINGNNSDPFEVTFVQLDTNTELKLTDFIDVTHYIFECAERRKMLEAFDRTLDFDMRRL